MNVLEYAAICRRKSGAKLSEAERIRLRITARLRNFLIIEISQNVVLLPYARVGKDTIINNYRYGIEPTEPWEYDEGDIIYLLGIYSPALISFPEMKLLRNKIARQFKVVYIRTGSRSRMWIYGRKPKSISRNAL